MQQFQLIAVSEVGPRITHRWKLGVLAETDNFCFAGMYKWVDGIQNN